MLPHDERKNDRIQVDPNLRHGPNYRPRRNELRQKYRCDISGCDNYVHATSMSMLRVGTNESPSCIVTDRGKTGERHLLFVDRRRLRRPKGGVSLLESSHRAAITPPAIDRRSMSLVGHVHATGGHERATFMHRERPRQDQRAASALGGSTTSTATTEQGTGFPAYFQGDNPRGTSLCPNMVRENTHTHTRSMMAWDWLLPVPRTLNKLTAQTKAMRHSSTQRHRP